MNKISKEAFVQKNPGPSLDGFWQDVSWFLTYYLSSSKVPKKVSTQKLFQDAQLWLKVTSALHQPSPEIFLGHLHVKK